MYQIAATLHLRQWYPVYKKGWRNGHCSRVLHSSVLWPPLRYQPFCPLCPTANYVKVGISIKWLRLSDPNIYTLGNPFAHPGKNTTHPSVIYVENVHFDWFNKYSCTGEHFQSDLDIFQFDLLFVKPHDVPPLLCANMQTEMRFWL